jgi:predicted metal-binding membrane protein
VRKTSGQAVASIAASARPSIAAGQHGSPDRGPGSNAQAAPLFAGSYFGVWALAGVVVYALYRPHGTVAADAAAIVAAIYEFTPLEQRFRRRCRDSARSGFQFGLCSTGSSSRPRRFPG